MDWAQDMTARWLRIMSAAGPGGMPLDEAVHQLGEISQINQPTGKRSRFGRHGRTGDTLPEAALVMALSRQLIAGVLVSNALIDQLAAATGQDREQVISHLSDGLPQQVRDEQLRALLFELSGSCTLLQDPGRASYSGLGGRVEQLLLLAEQQARELVEAARAEAAQITSSAQASRDE
jgi:hypothetical protein